MLSIYEDGVTTTFSLLSLLNHILLDYVLEASRVIWAYRPLWSIVLHLAGPLFFLNLEHQALYNHYQHKIHFSALGLSTDWPSLSTSRVQVERNSFISKSVNLSRFSLPLHSLFFVLCFETCFYENSISFSPFSKC